MDTVFNKLIEIMEKYENVIIMGHKDPDLDAVGSAMGLSVVLEKIGKKSYLFLSTKGRELYNTSVVQALAKASKMNYIYIEDYKELLGEKTALMIVDVHQKDRLEYPEILDEIEPVIIIDHHIKNNDYIRDTELFYIDSTMSSVIEFVADFAAYCDVNLGSLISSIMLAGMEIDTNGFNLKTSEKTFEVAAYLTSMGADTVLKQELLKESKDDYLRRADFIKSSYIIHKNIAMCMLPTTSSSKEELAEIAEGLLKFEYVEASFVIGHLEDDFVGVSARSIGNMDVCQVMKQLGGGGHMTNAATQISGKTVMEVEKKLRKVLGEML